MYFNKNQSVELSFFDNKYSCQYYLFLYYYKTITSDNKLRLNLQRVQK
jgi:hypothetical protein